LTVIEDNLARWSRNYRNRFDYRKGENWKRINELRKRGRTSSPRTKHKFMRNLLFARMILWSVSMLILALLLKSGGG